MFWKILIRIFRRHVTYHLLIPLVVGVVVDLLLMASAPHWPRTTGGVREYFLSIKWVGLVVGIFAAYFVIMYFVVKEETTARIDSGGHAILNGCLKGAVSYFAVNTIGVREWFGPAMQEYLSVITRHREVNPDFKYERVMLFFKRRDFDALSTPFLDYNYAHAVAQIHKSYGIPLSYLQRRDIHRIFRHLTVGQRKAIGCYPRWLAWCPQWVLKLSLWRLRPRMLGMGFVLIEMSDGGKVALRVTKDGDNMIIKKIAGHAVEPYAKVVKLIKEIVYVRGTDTLKPEYDFLNRVT